MYFDIEAIPKPVIEAGSSGSVEIKETEFDFTLLNNGVQWMTYNKSEKNQYDQFYSSYDLAYGDVLLSGLGFGLLAMWVASKPEVSSVTVIETSKEVIDLFLRSNPLISKKIKIVNGDMTFYITNEHYDGIFLDHYELQSHDWRINNMREICNRISHDVFWSWSLEAIYLNKMYSLPENNGYGLPLEFLEFHERKLHSKWEEFASSTFPRELQLLDLTYKKINSYLESFFYMSRKGSTLKV